MRLRFPFGCSLAAALGTVVACSSSKPHPTTGKFEDCYYDCKPAPKSAQTDANPTIAKATPAAAPGKLTPAGEKAQLLRDAADLLDKAGAALADGNKSRAEQLFSSAELITGPEPIASLAAMFREGAPPRITAPTEKVDTHATPQPRVVGSSEA